MHVLPCAPPPGKLSEGPVWDARAQVLTWVDILPGLIHTAELVPRPEVPDLRLLHTVSLDRAVGAAVPRESGGLLAAAGTGFRFVPGDQEFAGLDLPDDGVARRMNDAKCDPCGRLLAGTMAFDARPDAGALVSLDSAGRVRTLLDPVTISNGLGWSPDGRLLYYADSATHRVDVFDYDLETGDLGGRRTFAEVADGAPDGLTVDAAGRVWVAIWGAGEVRAYHPDGSAHAVVPVPAAHVSSCTFAGPDLDVLVITTATEGRSAADLAGEPDAGRLFTCKPGATGLPATPFDDRST
ncbi:Sugar lactone lactonase YvrE [Actinokineospora alba]|uniref:Sugar lactone lactonase YvrE n=1 Tax=Actinokineospora alba TaxID=504798 RepID=A0A1H0EWM6_9PSEU|nr:SMP-30/gluconolactonase/LRE family protein [Actinokineospora alba]TDP69252.1 sugar lactone lactonase YvrE [Actinokineospora alba]SDI20935.1 Sugar lactone lactonase YvrE [Actinokineospora alba]SDN86768.1 Sugar lactone lactonase YvrE [Actinokineospora alba]